MKLNLCKYLRTTEIHNLVCSLVLAGFTSKTESGDPSRSTSASLMIDLDVEGRVGDSAAPKRSLSGDLTSLILIPPISVITKPQIYYITSGFKRSRFICHACYGTSKNRKTMKCSKSKAILFYSPLLSKTGSCEEDKALLKFRERGCELE